MSLLLLSLGGGVDTGSCDMCAGQDGDDAGHAEPRHVKDGTRSPVRYPTGFISLLPTATLQFTVISNCCSIICALISTFGDEKTTNS